ncbi:MAG: SagB/ThcOx family dehydrogenase [Candidatus Ozemobacteraceae bacterium]
MKKVGKEFLQQTRLANLSASAQEDGLPQPLLTCEPLGTGVAIPLPSHENVHPTFPKFYDLVTKRRSLREYNSMSVSSAELSYLLRCTQGVKKVVPGKATFRTVPSAGARHPMETFVLCNRVDEIPSGLYWYDAIEHRLKDFDIQPGIADQLAKACCEQNFVRNSAVAFFWVAIVERTTWRYAERAYRYFFLDAGHICQNLYLASETIDCGACAIAAFDDEQVNRLLRLDGDSAFTVYAATVGKR